MKVELVTLQDLQALRTELLQDLKELIAASAPAINREWIKGAHVRELLGISHGTLRKLRANGTLRCTRVGGIFYYRYEDINTLLETPGQEQDGPD